MSHFDRVHAFMRRFGQETPGRPTAPDDETLRKRDAWLLEEVLELLESHYEVEPGQLESAASDLIGIIRWARVRFDMVGHADANADIRYIAIGNDIAAGIDSRDIDAEVARSNDTKEPPAEPGGKVAKGESYSPPAIAAILKEQGWKP